MNRFRRAALLLFLAFSLPLLRARAEPPAGVPQSVRHNLLIVVANCLNRNHLSLNGYPKKSTPHLDRFRQDAFVFKNLVSPATFTPPVMRELFNAAPWGRDFFASDGWDAWYLPRLTDYPAGRFLSGQGYDYFHEELPSGDRPFAAYLNFTDLHFPYDLFRQRGRSLNGPEGRLYRSLLKRIDEITLVEQPAVFDAFPAQMDYLIFSTRRTEVPIGDAKTWDSLLNDLKSPGNPAAARIAAGLPPRLTRRLSRVRNAGELTLRDKKRILRALNGFVRDAESPVGGLLFGEDTYFKDKNLVFCGRELYWEDSLFAFNIDRQLAGPDPVLVRRADRLALAKPLDGNQKKRLRQIYREALEYVLPGLAFHHPQTTFIGPHPRTLEAWKKSAGHARDLALLKSIYDAALTDLDNKFGKALEHLRRRGVLDNTVVVFMGDHGEAFMEHGHMEHVYAECYDEVVNPPLLIRAPGRLSSMKLVETQLRTADVLPTAIELMGLRLPQVSTAPAGVSLARSLAGAPAPDLPAFSRNYTTSRSIRRNDGWKLIWEMGTDRRELYDTGSDPMETRNVATDFPRILADLEEELKRYLFGP